MDFSDVPLCVLHFILHHPEFGIAGNKWHCWCFSEYPFTLLSNVEIQDVLQDFLLVFLNVYQPPLAIMKDRRV